MPQKMTKISQDLEERAGARMAHGHVHFVIIRQQINSSSSEPPLAPLQRLRASIVVSDV